MSESNSVLPQFLKLTITNMTTFPNDLRISFEKGINVVFGGNHSGKTTLVNSIKYGIFGLSWSTAPESVEKRYFSYRIKEISRKSLDINLIYNLKYLTSTVNRTIFSSGTAEIKSITGLNESPLSSAEILNHEKDYYEDLRENMGLINSEQLKFIPTLIFADENRQLVLWTKNLESVVLGLLTSKESIEQVQFVESQLNKAIKDLGKLKQDKDQILKRNLEKIKFSDYLKESVEAKERDGKDTYEKEYKKLVVDLDDCKVKCSRLKDELQNELIIRSQLQENLSNNQKKLLEIKSLKDQFNEQLLKGFLNPKDPKETHFGRIFYYEKKCPFCSADLSSEINNRVENKKCPICGIGYLINQTIDMDDIDRKLTDLDNETIKTLSTNNDIQEKIIELNKKIEELSQISKEEEDRQRNLIQKISGFKAIEENLQKKQVMTKELDEVLQDIDKSKMYLAKIEDEVKKVNEEIEKINMLQNKMKDAIKLENNLSLSKIREIFSSFIGVATNGELSGQLTDNFIPSLNGRLIFYPEQISQFERGLMDCAFRIAVLSVFAKRTGTIPSLVLETPDEVTDEAYIPYLAEAIQKFSSNMSIIITTVNSEMMKQLLKDYDSEERKKRLINLVSQGTLTQRKFYELPLKEYIGDN
ncbi:MAG: AAA family ATPase [Candidatus Bathyarchaeia archaeon]